MAAPASLLPSVAGMVPWGTSNLSPGRAGDLALPLTQAEPGGFPWEPTSSPQGFLVCRAGGCKAAFLPELCCLSFFCSRMAQCSPLVSQRETSALLFHAAKPKPTKPNGLFFFLCFTVTALKPNIFMWGKPWFSTRILFPPSF